MGTRVSGNSIVNGESFFVFYLIGFRGKTMCFSPLIFFGGKLRVKGMESDKVMWKQKKGRSDLVTETNIVRGNTSQLKQEQKTRV